MQRKMEKKVEGSGKGKEARLRRKRAEESLARRRNDNGSKRLRSVVVVTRNGPLILPRTELKKFFFWDF